MSKNILQTTTFKADREKPESISVSPKLIPIPDWPKRHSWPTQSGLRYWIFHAKTNGFEKVIRRIGRRVLIDEEAFFEWVNTQNQQGGSC